MSSAWTFADWLQYLLSFGLVIGLLLALLWTLRKLQNGAVLRKSFQRMQVVETLSIGPRQKNRPDPGGWSGSPDWHHRTKHDRLVTGARERVG